MNTAALSFDVDVAIFGGGIGGLWLLNRLLARGYNAVLTVPCDAVNLPDDLVGRLFPYPA